jgi:hypothetical protein
MQNQHFITKDENGNYVIATPVMSADSNGYTLEKKCTLTCAGADPCKNCDKCNKPSPDAPLIPIVPSDPASPLVPADPATVAVIQKMANYRRMQQQRNIKFIEKGGLSTASKVLIAFGVLLLLIVAFYVFKMLYKRFNKLLSKKDASFDYNDKYMMPKTRNMMGLPEASSDDWSTVDTDDS